MQTAAKPKTRSPQSPPITGVYKIVCSDGVYVGQSTNILDRAHEHLYGSDRGAGLATPNKKHKNGNLQQAYDRDPNSFKVYLIEECDRSQLNKIEAYWIKKIGTLNIQRPRVGIMLPRRDQNKFLLNFSELRKKLEENDRPNQNAKAQKGGTIDRLLVSAIAGCLIGLGLDSATDMSKLQIAASTSIAAAGIFVLSNPKK